jgi:hypothetical protein
MLRYITVPIEANGIIDPDKKIQDIVARAIPAALSVADTFIYFHSWSNAAIENHNVATAGFISFTSNKGHRKAGPPMCRTAPSDRLEGYFSRQPRRVSGLGVGLFATSHKPLGRPLLFTADLTAFHASSQNPYDLLSMIPSGCFVRCGSPGPRRSRDLPLDLGVTLDE